MIGRVGRGQTWQPRDLPPEARRAAEAAADAAGVPLADWIAETVRSAIVKELGSLPAADPVLEPAEPEPEARELPPESTPPATPTAKAAQTPPPDPAQKVELEPTVLAKPMSLAGGDRARGISPEAQRLVESGLTSWLATRIEGPAPTPPSATRAAAPPPAAGSPPAPSQPQLNLSSAAPAPAQAPASSPPPESTPAKTIMPLALPTGPVATLPLAALRPARCRSRRSGIDLGIPELAASVAAQGVREPILVRRLAGDANRYEVVAGERRRLAAEHVSRADVPAVVVEADDAEALMLSLAENLGRQDFSPLDEGRAYLRLLTEYGVNPSVLAQRLARERTQIALAMRLLGLPELVRRSIDSGQLTPAQAYALLGALDPEAMAEQLIRGGAAQPG